MPIHANLPMPETTLKIRFYGDPCLRKKSVPVGDIGPGERLLIKSMMETMHAAKGIGLAAPQVGINQRILVADIGEGPVALINPKVLKRSGSAELEEGCLSIPGVQIVVKRPVQIVVQYTDINNRTTQRVFTDLLARVILHETDHLNGKLIVDYAGFIERRKFKKQLKELSAKYKPKKS